MTSEQNYSALDRALHRLAFASPAVQFTAADVEESLYGNRFRAIKVEKPIFITSLPRAGTTLMLEVLSGLPGLATHSYRDMPFVLAPLLWDVLSKNFRKASRLKERAHGDGMMVGYDSPEAFEEILWRAFWPQKFKRDRILLWSKEENADEFQEFFRCHMQKIIALRSTREAQPRRYISKNNANVARIGLLKRLFPSGLIVIPFRRPVDQAVSLLRQHQRFLELHRQDRFSKRYMDDIGHLEFGELHRPIDFAGMDEIRSRYRPDTLDYWIAYWIHGFRHIIQYKKDVSLVSYERLCKDGQSSVRVLTELLGIQHDQVPNPAGSDFRPPREYKDGIGDQQLLDQASVLHTTLLDMSLV